MGFAARFDSVQLSLFSFLSPLKIVDIIKKYSLLFVIHFYVGEIDALRASQQTWITRETTATSMFMQLAPLGKRKFLARNRAHKHAHTRQDMFVDGLQ